MSSNNKSKLSARDQLTATTDEGKIELNEQELARVSAGGKIAPFFLKISPQFFG